MTMDQRASTPAPPKVDPEKLELRARPRPAIRFRKGLVVGLAGGTAGLIAMVSWFALDPPGFRLDPIASANEPGQHPVDALEGVPASYDQVPKLGPPLPGDLGRPILKRQAAQSQPGDSLPEADGRRAEEERLANARSSSLMVSLAERPALIAEPVARPTGSAAADAAASPRAILSAGTIIPASLVTGINSDVPGIVLAQVTEPVRDSATGELVIIPQGARLIGEYDSRVAYGQRRAMLSWNQIVLPDGRSVPLDKLPASDREGYSGLADEVDFHGWRLMKGIALSTALGIGTELSAGDGEEALARALGDSAQLATARAGDELTRLNLEIKPTITVRPGWPVRVILHRDLTLEAWKG